MSASSATATRRLADDRPIFRLLMGGGRRPKDRIGSTSLHNAVLANLRRARCGARSHVASRTLGAGARGVVVRAHLLRMNASGCAGEKLVFDAIARRIDEMGPWPTLARLIVPCERIAAKSGRYKWLRRRIDYVLVRTGATFDVDAFPCMYAMSAKLGVTYAGRTI